MKIEVSLEEMEQIEEIIIVGKDDFAQGGSVGKVMWVEEPYCECAACSCVPIRYTEGFTGTTNDPVGKVHDAVDLTEKMHDDDIIVGPRCGTHC